GDPVTLALSVADREPLIHVDPDAAWAALEADEHGWQGWGAGMAGGPAAAGRAGRPRKRAAGLVWRDRRRPPPPRRGGPQPAHPAAADLLPIRRAGRGTDHLPPRGPGRDPQLGLPLRLAPRRQHRHWRLPRRRQTRRSPPLPRLAAPRQPPAPTRPALAAP